MVQEGRNVRLIMGTIECQYQYCWKHSMPVVAHRSVAFALPAERRLTVTLRPPDKWKE